MENSTAVERGDAFADSPGRHRTDADGPQFLRARRAMRDDARLAGHPVLAFIVVALVGFVLLAAVMLGGCAALSSSTPFNPAQSCQASGGSYYNGQCHAGFD